MKKYRFVKDYTCSLGTLKKNSEIQLVNGVMYYNGGMLSDDYMKIMYNIINNDPDEEYIKEVPMIKDEF